MCFSCSYPHLKLSLWFNQWPDDKIRGRGRCLWSGEQLELVSSEQQDSLTGVMVPSHLKLCACLPSPSSFPLPTSPPSPHHLFYAGCPLPPPWWLPKCYFQLLSGALQLFPLLLPRLFSSPTCLLLSNYALGISPSICTLSSGASPFPSKLVRHKHVPGVL